MCKKLKLREDDYIVIKRLNLLSFCPSLVKYTKFENEILKTDDDFKKDDNKSKTVSHQVSNSTQDKDKEKKFSKTL